MVVAVNPVYPVIAAQGVAADVALQPGTVIDAQVLKLLANDFVRIAVSNLAIDVMSEVPLQVGQALQLAVSQTPNGMRLQIVPQSAGDMPSSPTDGEAPATIVSTSTGGTSSTSSSTTASSSATVNAPVSSARVIRPLTNLEAMAVTAAVQNAAARQGSLSPLFANLGVATSSEILPAPLKEAAQQLLSARSALDPSLSGEDVKAAFENSGLFLEQSQKLQGAAPSSQSQGAPDLKAALIVFRQTLSSWLNEASGAQAGDDAAPLPAANSVPVETAVTDDHAQPQPGIFAQQGQARVQSDLAVPLAPPMVPEIEMDEILLPQASLPFAEDIDDAGYIMRDVTPAENTAGRAAVSPDILGAAVAKMAMAGKMPGAGSFEDVLQAFPKGVQDAVQTMLEAQTQTGALRTPANQNAPINNPLAHDDVPPPPFRGAATSAQPVASPSIAAEASPDIVAHHLLNDTDAALARQTLLQIASLPERVDQPGVRADLNVPRWNFEIPFATPQGTAVAQFEISRDGGGDKEGTASASKVWRARFSLNVEPAGPVHALVSLSGDKTSVRMWAERASTAQQLRANKSELTIALREAELDPGEIVIAEGQAPSPASPPRGHFLDRAL